MDIKATITVIEGEDLGKSLEITKQRTVAGRTRGDLLLSDKKTSGEHVCFTVEKGKLFVEDLASTNGTFVNGERIEEKTELHNLDEITVGFSKLQVSVVENLKVFREKNRPSAKAKEREKRPKKPRGKKGDIAGMIDEELKRFSRWDLVKRDSVPSFSRRLQMPKVHLSLEVIAGPEKGRVVRVSKGNSVIGRGKADVSFKDRDISRNHCSIECFSENQIFVRDLASTNGTFLNKKRISYSKLKDGDVIQIGSTQLRFVAGKLTDEEESDSQVQG